MNGVSCACCKKSCDLATGLAACMSVPRVETGYAGPHSSCFSEVYSDRQHNEVVKNMGTEARLPGSPAS